MNYPRRQQRRRLFRAGRLALGATALALFGVLLIKIGFALPGGMLLAIAVIIGIRSRHWLSLAGRSGVGESPWWISITYFIGSSLSGVSPRLGMVAD